MDQKYLYVLDAEDHVLFAVNGLQYNSDSYTDNFLGVAELTFRVNRYIWTPYPTPQLIESVGYNHLKEGMSLYVTDIGIFKITEVAISNDSYEEYKAVSASSVEYELQNRDLTTFIINEGITGSKEMLATGNVTDAGLPIEDVSIYNKDNPELSFLDLVLDESPDWSVGEVDDRLYLDGLTAVLPMEIDSQSVYSILMEELSQNNKVVVTFDRKHRKINCHSNSSLDVTNDTNIFIRYENLANAVEIQRQNEGIFTRFNVAGGEDLTIEQVNLGENRIEDLRWIVSQKSGDHSIYVTDSLAEKYNRWYETREELRKQYVELTKTYNQYVIELNELQTLDCMDALKIDLSTYKDEELSGLKETYIKQCNVLASASGYVKKDSDGNLVVDSDGYAVITDTTAFKASAYYTEWDLYKNTLIANIEIEQYNRKIKADSSLTKDEKEKKYKDEITAWETQWELYGIDACETKLTVYEAQLDSLKETNYQLTWDEAKAAGVTGIYNKTTWDEYHDEYVKIKAAYDGCTQRLNELYAEKVKMESQQDAVNLQRVELVAKSQKSHEDYGFTESELLALSRLLIDTDYQNESFLTTSVDDVVTALDAAENLYQAAAEELETESQEQLSFSVTLDNLFNIEEFKLWHGDFAVGNFIRVGILDDYYIRMRIVSIQRSLFNPESNDLTISFSNLLRSNGSLSDLDTLYNAVITSTKNQIDATIRSDKTLSEIYLNDDILKALANSSIFSATVTNIVSDSIKAKTGVFQAISSQYLGSNVIEAAVANISSATIDVLMNKYASSFQGDFVGINADTIKAGTLSVERLIIRPTEEQLAENPNIKSVIYEINNLGDIVSEKVDPDYADQLLINGKALVAHSITAIQIHAETITTGELASDAIKSRSYAPMADDDGNTLEVNADHPYSAHGTIFYLGDSSDVGNSTTYISSENFAIDKDGNAYFRGSGSFDGTVIANGGKVGPWSITETSIYKGSDELGTQGDGNIYLGDDGLSLSNKLIYNTENDSLTITGTITGSNVIGGTLSSGDGTSANRYITINKAVINFWHDYSLDDVDDTPTSRGDGDRRLSGYLMPINWSENGSKSEGISFITSSSFLALGYYKYPDIYSSYIINNGLDPNGYTERHIFRDDARFVNNVTIDGDITNSGWFISSGATGWRNNTHGGGWYMTDDTWIRAYGSKDVYIEKNMRIDGLVKFGNTEKWYINSNGGAMLSGVTAVMDDDDYCQIRATYNHYGFMIRNDDTMTYFLLTDSDDPHGQWNSLRPFAINNSTGAVNIDTSLTVNGTLSVGGANPLLWSSYGGGWYMVDDTWIRSYGSKSVYLDTMLRVDGRIQCGGSGNYYIDPTGGAVLLSASFGGKLSIQSSGISLDNNGAYIYNNDSDGNICFRYRTSANADYSYANIVDIAGGNFASLNVSGNAVVGGELTVNNNANFTGAYTHADMFNMTNGGVSGEFGVYGSIRLGSSGSSYELRNDGTIVVNTITCNGITSNGAIYDQYGYEQSTSNNNPTTYVSSSGRLARYASSSKRYKNTIESAADSLYKPLLDLPVVTYHYNPNYDCSDPEGTKEHIGFIAESVDKLYPKACGYNDDGQPENWNVMELVPGMLGLIQDAYKKIDELENEIKELKSAANI